MYDNRKAPHAVIRENNMRKFVFTQTILLQTELSLAIQGLPDILIKWKEYETITALASYKHV